jgi:hypothetical protein
MKTGHFIVGNEDFYLRNSTFEWCFRPMVNKQADSFHGEIWFFTQRSGKIWIDKSVFIDLSF